MISATVALGNIVELLQRWKLIYQMCCARSRAMIESLYILPSLVLCPTVVTANEVGEQTRLYRKAVHESLREYLKSELGSEMYWSVTSGVCMYT